MNNGKVYSQKRIQIYTYNRQLHLISGQRPNRIYPIAVGKPETPTPNGIYSIINKIVNPGGGLGTRWMGLDIPNGPYGIHGTFKPETIGKAVSNGCIRMYNHDVEELFSLVHIGTTVMIDSLAPGTSRDFLTYITKPGDSLRKISRLFSVTTDELAKINDLDNPDRLQVGQELKIPK